MAYQPESAGACDNPFEEQTLNWANKTPLANQQGPLMGQARYARLVYMIRCGPSFSLRRSSYKRFNFPKGVNPLPPTQKPSQAPKSAPYNTAPG